MLCFQSNSSSSSLSCHGIWGLRKQAFGGLQNKNRVPLKGSVIGFNYVGAFIIRIRCWGPIGGLGFGSLGV